MALHKLRRATKKTSSGSHNTESKSTTKRSKGIINKIPTTEDKR